VGQQGGALTVFGPVGPSAFSQSPVRPAWYRGCCCFETMRAARAAHAHCSSAIQAVRGDGEQVWVVIKQVCEGLGLRDHGQTTKLKNKPWAVTQLIWATAVDGKAYESLCLSLDSLPIWLATIDAKRVKPEVQPKLIAAR